VEFLARKQEPALKRPRRILKGALSHLNIHVTEEDIAEALWGNFPREELR
jgi:hypothetical protein